MYKGQLEGFPEEIVEKILDYQVAQGNPRDISIFEYDIAAGALDGGFYWSDTKEGDFWEEVLLERNFDTFFRMYPIISDNAVVITFDRAKEIISEALNIDINLLVIK